MSEDQSKITDNVLELRELSPQLAKRILRELVDADDGRIFISNHAEVRMIERRITRTQINRCLSAGCFDEEPHWDNRYGNWQMKLRVISAGDNISVVATLDHEDGDNYSLVVSVMY